MNTEQPQAQIMSYLVVCITKALAILTFQFCAVI